MRPEVLKYLYDVLQALDAIDEICGVASYDAYADSITLRSAVERQFEIAGEALSQMGKIDSHTFERVPDAAQVVAFRNFLIHQYAQINTRLVWGVMKNDLPGLRAAVKSLLAEGEAASPLH
jgi:uncharacterized protein with HEPN domain